MKVEVEVALSDEDVARIAKAVAAELRAGAAPRTEVADKPTTKPTKATKADKPAEAPKPEEPKVEGPTRQAVLEKLNAAADKLGSKDAAMAIVKQFAPKFTEVTEAQYGDLIAALDKAIEGGAPAEEAESDGWE